MHLLSVKGLRLLLIWTLPFVSPMLLAQDLKSTPQQEPAVNEVDADVASTIITRLKQARPDLNVANVRNSPMPGVYKVDLNGQMAFVSADGGFLIAGEMYQVNPGYLVNLQEQERMQQEMAFAPKRAAMLKSIQQKDMVVYTPEKETKGHVYVFTDIDCGFCRRLHSQIDDMLNKGIEVRYLAFPRAGINSRSAQKLATVWCSSDPQQTMTRFKHGENVPLDTCEVTPVADHYMLGQRVGVRGTPAIVLESGQLIPGAVSPEMLAKEMGI